MHLLSYTEKNGVAKLEEICLFTTYLYTATISFVDFLDKLTMGHYLI